MSEISRVDAIINGINKLNNEEKRELTIKVRTTTEGVKAYTSFLYGLGNAVDVPPVDVPDCHDTTNIPDSTGSDADSENNNTNASEDWL